MHRTYTVPNRFGLRAIFLVVAIVAAVCAVTMAIEAELRVVAPVLSFVLLVCLAQMAFGWIPRLASAIVGGLVFPTSALIDPLFSGRVRFQPVSWIDLFWLTTCGLLVGYCGGALLAGLFLIGDRLGEKKDRIYSVPRKFGTGTILLATTMFAMLFAVLNYAQARPWQLVFYTSFVVTVGAAQMFLPRTPRWASIVAGAIFLPMSIMLYGRIGRQFRLPAEDTTTTFFIVMVGCFVGYLGGTMIAGIFLLSDYTIKTFKLLLRGRIRNAQSAAPLEEQFEGSTLTLLAQRASANRQKSSG